LTILWGDTGKVAVGTLKTFTITPSTPSETLLGTPVSSLPTVNPGSGGAQISYTIQQSDLPTINPAPISTKYSAVFMIGGKNTDAAAQSIGYQIFKNGSSVYTSSPSVTASNFYTLNAYLYDVKVGDIISVALWCTNANMNYDYYGIVVSPTRPKFTKDGTIVKDFSMGGLYGNGNTAGVPTKGNPQLWTNSVPYLYPGTRKDSGNPAYNVQLNWGIQIPYFAFNTTYNAFLTDYGDNSQRVDTVVNATFRPRYARADYPSTISFREILR
jgi:hypothetical protein